MTDPLARTLSGTAAGKAAMPHPVATLLQARLNSGSRSRAAFAVRVHLSRLRVGAGLATAGRFARQPLIRLLMQSDIDMIDLGAGDTLLVCGEGAVDRVDAALARVRELLTPDMLPPSLAAEDDGLATWFDLSVPADHAALTALAAGLPPAEIAIGRRPPTPADVARLCAFLHQEPVTDLIHQQVVLWMKGPRLWTTLFRETYIAIPELERRYLPEVDLLAHPALFRFVTETLDRRMLAALTVSDLMAGRAPISLNLNLASFRTPEFATFQEIRDDLPRPIVELQLADVLGDPDGFVAVRARLQGQGYSILIDGVSLRDLEYIDLSPLACDFIKLIWREAVDCGMRAERSAHLKEAIARLGPERVVLARLETEQALQWALTAGITCLQGRYIDSLLTAMTRKGLAGNAAP